METKEKRGEIQYYYALEPHKPEIVKSGDCWLCDVEQIIENSNDELFRIEKQGEYEKIYLRRYTPRQIQGASAALC